MSFLHLFLSNAQSVNDSLELVSINKLYEVSKGKYDSTAYFNHHKILSIAKKTGSYIREVESYNSLAWFHGNGHIKERRLDSTLYYFNMFEDNIPKLDSLGMNKIISFHYINKGYLLANRFGLLEEGLTAYQNAYPKIDDNDFNTQVYYDILVAQLYKDKYQYEKAEKLLISRIKDTAALSENIKLYLMQNLASSYKKNKKPKKGLIINQQILEKALKSNNEYYIWWTKKEITYNYFLMGETQKAIDSALVLKKYYKENFNKDALKDISDYLGDYYTAKGDLNNAIFYKEGAVKKGYHINDLPIKYGELASLYSKIKNDKKATFYYKRKDKVIDSIRSREQLYFTTYADNNIQFLKQKKLNYEIKQKNKNLKLKNNKQKIFIALLTLFLLFFLIFLTTYYLRIKSKKQLKSLEVLAIEQKKNLLEKKVKFRDEELAVSTKAISSSLSRLSEIKNELEKGSFSDAEKVVKTSKEIEILINSASNLSMITDKFASKYSGFTILLNDKHPGLSSRELDYCLLTKLNLSIKETASILNVSPGTVKVARSRLKSKLKIPSNISFKDYLNSLDT